MFSFLLLTAISISLQVHSANAIDDYNFVAAGDWGCTSNTDSTINNMISKSPERVLGLGDYSYASTGSCWFNKISPLQSITKIAIGNHEDDSSEGFSGYMSQFGLSETYYSFNYQNTHLLVMDTDRNVYASGSPQHTFVINDLQSASQNPSIDWIIVYLHKFMYTSPSEESAFTSLRNTYHPIFQQYGVDLVVQGHQHTYQRTFPIKYNTNNPSDPTKTSTSQNDYTDTDGQIFAIVGTGGQNFDPLSGKATFVASQQSTKFGMLDIKITNDGSKLEGKHYTNDGSLFDQFSITKVNSPPVANNQAISVIKDTSKSITLNATDSENNPLSYTIVTPPSHGTISGGSGAIRTYTPALGYTGPDSFTFKANDGTVDSNVGTVSLNVQASTGTGGGYNYSPSLVLTGSNYHDVANTAALRLSQFSVAAWFKTSSNFGSDSILVNKGGLGSESSGQNMNYGIWMTSTETIKAGFETSSGTDQYVTSVNSYNDNKWHYAVVTYGGSTVILYIDGVQVATKSTSGATPETSGTKPVRVGANSRITPPGNFFIGQVDEVRVWNDDLTSQQVANSFAGNVNTAGQVLYLPFGTNAPPVANNQIITVNKNTQKAITLTATDPNIDPLVYTIVTPPQNGTLSGTAPNLNYNPNTNHVGTDSFTFKVNDGTVDSNIATVSITVQDEGQQGGYHFDPSLSLTGSNYDEAPSTSSLQLSQFSVAAWFKTSSNFASDAFIVNKGGAGSDSSGENLNYGLWMNSLENLKVGFETSTGADQYLTSPLKYNDGQWHYAVVTYGGSTIILYVDGVQVGTKSTSGATPETSGTKPVRVGANSRITPSGNFFIGQVDEVRVWNDDLTSQQVADAFAGNSFTTASQRLYLDFGTSSASSTGYQYGPSLTLTGP